MLSDSLRFVGCGLRGFFVDFKTLQGPATPHRTCHPEQDRATGGSEGASKDPDNASSAMLTQGVFTRIHQLLQCAVVAFIFLDRNIIVPNGQYNRTIDFPDPSISRFAKFPVILKKFWR